MPVWCVLFELDVPAAHFIFAESGFAKEGNPGCLVQCLEFAYQIRSTEQSGDQSLLALECRQFVIEFLEPAFQSFCQPGPGMVV